MGSDDGRGWLKWERVLGANMPGNWTSAEMMNLPCDLFVHEDGERLVLGLGVLATWLQPGVSFGVRNLPTTRETVSYIVTVNADGIPELAHEGPSPYTCAWLTLNGPGKHRPFAARSEVRAVLKEKSE